MEGDSWAGGGLLVISSVTRTGGRHGAADATDAAPADPVSMRLHSATAEAPAAVPPATSTARTVHTFLFGGSDGAASLPSRRPPSLLPLLPH
jgi:hypothetical protein